MEDEDPIEELKCYLYQQLAELKASYQKAAAPIIAELLEIEKRKPPKPIIITRLLDGTVTFVKPQTLGAELGDHDWRQEV